MGEYIETIDDFFLLKDEKVVLVWKGGDDNFGTPELVQVQGNAKDVINFMTKRCNLCPVFDGTLPVDWRPGEFRTFECFPPGGTEMGCDEVEDMSWDNDGEYPEDSDDYAGLL